MKSLLIISLITIFTAYELYAIPAFARKYNMSCKTCHSPFPALKPYGSEFAGNGFVLKDQDAPRYYAETGDPELSLIRDLPLAMKLEGYLSYNEGQTEESDFTTPLLFKLLSGGAISNNLAYFVYYILENGERGKIEDAWLMFNNLFGSELDVSVGQFQVCDPLFKRELRLTKDDYYIYKASPGLSKVNLTYDRGVIISYGFESETEIVMEIINGNGIDEGISGRFDSDAYKNLFGRVNQGIGEHFRIGAMGYWGKEKRDFDYQLNETWMAGGDATISFNKFELNAQYVKRNDDNPLFQNPESEAVSKIATQGAFAELIIRPEGDDSKFYGVALFNWIESDQSDLNYKTISGHIGYLLRRNIRLTAEINYDINKKYSRFGVGFISTF